MEGYGIQAILQQEVEVTFFSFLFRELLEGWSIVQTGDGHEMSHVVWVCDF